MYIYIFTYIHTQISYIYICVERERGRETARYRTFLLRESSADLLRDAAGMSRQRQQRLGCGRIGVDTNGAAAKVPLSKNMQSAVTPLVLTPLVPLRAPAGASLRCMMRPREIEKTRPWQGQVVPSRRCRRALPATGEVGIPDPNQSPG